MSSGKNVFPIAEQAEELAKVKKELVWYKAYCDQVQGSNHRAHEYACEHADEATGVIEYPYSEGDDYWTVEELDVHLEYEDNSGLYTGGIEAIQSCWDDQSKEFHREDPDREYFDSLDEVLQHARYGYEFIKVSCHFSGMHDIEDGDYFVTTDTNDRAKFQKSY
jgi:hypothetical protein